MKTRKIYSRTDCSFRNPIFRNPFQRLHISIKIRSTHTDPGFLRRMVLVAAYHQKGSFITTTPTESVWGCVCVCIIYTQNEQSCSLFVSTANFSNVAHTFRRRLPGDGVCVASGGTAEKVRDEPILCSRGPNRLLCMYCWLCLCATTSKTRNRGNY